MLQLPAPNRIDGGASANTMTKEIIITPEILKKIGEARERTKELIKRIPKPTRLRIIPKPR